MKQFFIVERMTESAKANTKPEKAGKRQRINLEDIADFIAIGAFFAFVVISIVNAILLSINN